MNTLISESEWPELMEADPLADSVVEDWLKNTEADRARLLQGMKLGSKTIPEAPPSYLAFLQEAESLITSEPDIHLARQAYFLAKPVWISIALGPGALIHTYSDPAIAKTLVSTGKLIDAAAARRLAETQLWNLQILRDGAWQLGGAGYVQTLQVRLLHARVRARLKEHGQLGELTQISMNQQKMVRTWLGFAAVGPLALQRLGIDWTEEEKTAVISLWALVGRLLGIPQRLMDALAQPQSHQQWLNYFEPHHEDHAEDAWLLTRSMLNALAARMSVILKLPNQVSLGLMHAFARHIHGDQLANLMGVLPSEVDSLVPLYVDANRYRMLEIRRSEQKMQEQLVLSSREIEAIVTTFAGETAYQQT